MEKNVWWQAIKLFLNDILENTNENMFLVYWAIMFVVGAIVGLSVNKILGFGGLTFFSIFFLHAPVLLLISFFFFLYPLIVRDVKIKIDSFYLTIDCLEKYFLNFPTRVKQEVTSIQSKEEKEKIEKIKNCYKTLIEYWTSRLAEPEKLKVGEKEEIEESIARTLRLENLSVDDFGIIIPSHSDSISEELLVPQIDQSEKVEPEIAHPKTSSVCE